MDIKRICAEALADVMETYEDAVPMGDYLFDLNEEPQAVAKRLARIGKEMPRE